MLFPMKIIKQKTQICKDIIQENILDINLLEFIDWKSPTYSKKSVKRMINIETHPGKVTGHQEYLAHPGETIKNI